MTKGEQIARNFFSPTAKLHAKLAAAIDAAISERDERAAKIADDCSERELVFHDKAMDEKFVVGYRYAMKEIAAAIRDTEVCWCRDKHRFTRYDDMGEHTEPCQRTQELYEQLKVSE